MLCLLDCGMMMAGLWVIASVSVVEGGAARLRMVNGQMRRCRSSPVTSHPVFPYQHPPDYNVTA